MTTAGLILAAGAGRRMGTPKALVPGWLEGAIRVLREGGCAPVYVVLGAGAAQARLLVPSGIEIVIADDWDEGMGASLRAGLVALAPAAAALVHLVDLPDIGPEVVTRVAAAADRDSLRRATYDGRPGHPVLFGAAHWAPVIEQVRGDTGARAYLDAHGAVEVPCEDLATGRDVDRPG